MSLIKIAQIFQKYRSHLKVLGTRRVTCSKFRTEDTQILGDTVKKLVARATWKLGFGHPCLWLLYDFIIGFCNP